MGHEIVGTALHAMDGDENKKVNSDNDVLSVFHFTVGKPRCNRVMESTPALAPTLTRLTLYIAVWKGWLAKYLTRRVFCAHESLQYK